MRTRDPERRLSGVELGAWRGMLRVNAALINQLDADLTAAHGLPLRSYEVLLVLEDAPQRRMRMSDLSRSVLLSASGVSRLVDRLEAEGFVERERCTSDGRGYYAVLTDAGHAKLHGGAADTPGRGAAPVPAALRPRGAGPAGRVLGQGAPGSLGQRTPRGLTAPRPAPAAEGETVPDVIVVGAGLAGLCCARELASHGMDVLVLERSDDVGGRVRTDELDGFLLDRGFQVLLTAYPEARRALDYDGLALRPFLDGALVRRDGRFVPLADPLRRPAQAVRTLRDGPGSLLDKVRVARLRARLGRYSLSEVLHAPQVTTAEALRREGFSSAFTEAFWRPFLGGVFLDPELSTSSRLFAFVFKMFADGEAALPAAGMRAIPRQLAAALPAGSIRTGVTVESLERRPGHAGRRRDARGGGHRGGGRRARGRPAHRRLRGAGAASGHLPVLRGRALAPGRARCSSSTASGAGPVNNLCVPSDVAPSYAPPGAALVSATVLGIPQADDAALRRAVIGQLRGWFGAQVDDWRHLRTYRIPYALPALTAEAFAGPERPVRLRPGLFVCGDHRDTPSIQGAMVSGRRAAAAVRGLDVAPSCAP